MPKTLSYMSFPFLQPPESNETWNKREWVGRRDIKGVTQGGWDWDSEVGAEWKWRNKKAFSAWTFFLKASPIASFFPSNRSLLLPFFFQFSFIFSRSREFAILFALKAAVIPASLALFMFFFYACASRIDLVILLDRGWYTAAPIDWEPISLFVIQLPFVKAHSSKFWALISSKCCCRIWSRGT